MTNEAFNIDRSQALRLHVYYGMDGHSDTPEYQRLVADIESQRLGGLIFVSPPFRLVGTPLLDAPNLPRAAIMKPSVWPDMPDMPMVGYDDAMLCQRAMEYFTARSRRKLAVLAPIPQSAEFACTAAAAANVEIQPHWIQFVSHSTPEFACNCVHLLMHPGHRERPDALLIMDDNLVESATAGLIAAGVRIPEDLEVIAHCNFPYPTPSSLPIKRLGFDAREVLKDCLIVLDKQRSGERPSSEVVVPAIFEDEVR